jgi:hypothetical protein
MGVFYGPTGIRIISSGLIGYWDATLSKSYPGSGSTWNDLSSRGVNGTLSGSPTYSAGEMVFDGVDDRFNTSATTGINTGAITHCCLFSITGAGSVGNIPVFGNGTTFGHGIRVTTTTIQGGYTVDFSGYATSDLTISYNAWYFITTCWTSGGTVKMYQNGTLHSQSAVATGSIGTLLGVYTMGHAQNQYYLPCKISMAAVYNRELTASEINTNYQIFRGRYGL